MPGLRKERRPHGRVGQLGLVHGPGRALLPDVQARVERAGQRRGGRPCQGRLEAHRGGGRMSEPVLLEVHDQRRADRRTIGASDNRALLGGVRAKNNGRYNGNGRHWETPPEVFGPLNEEFSFTLDPCATAATAKCPRFFTEADDGLAQDWGRERVYMNPPYGREVYAWTKKAAQAARGGGACGGTAASQHGLGLVARGRGGRGRRGPVHSRPGQVPDRRAVPSLRLLRVRPRHLATQGGG